MIIIIIITIIVIIIEIIISAFRSGSCLLKLTKANLVASTTHHKECASSIKKGCPPAGPLNRIAPWNRSPDGMIIFLFSVAPGDSQV